MIKDEIAVIRHEVDRLRECLSAKLKEISDLENSCQHVWTEPKRVYQNNHYDCGSYGGAFTSHKWERECVECGKVEWTTREAMQPVPIFGDNKDVGKILISLPHG